MDGMNLKKDIIINNMSDGLTEAMRGLKAREYNSPIIEELINETSEEELNKLDKQMKKISKPLLTKEEFIIYVKALLDSELENARQKHQTQDVELVGTLKLIKEALQNIEETPLPNRFTYTNSKNNQQSSTNPYEGISWIYNIIT
jgi:hypothetical protein